MKIKTICINLKKSVDRKEKVKKLLDEIFDEYYFFDAINGAEINVIDTPLTNVKIVDYHNNLFFHNTNSRTLKMSYGEFGCALSHYILYNNLIHDTEYDAYLILEDDIAKAQRYNKDLIKLFLKELANVSFDVCYFHDYNFKQYNKMTNVHKFFYKLDGSGFAGTIAYVISKAGALKITKLMRNFINVPSDDVIATLFRLKKIDVIIPLILPFTHCGTESNIWNIYKDKEDYLKVKWDKPYTKLPDLDIYSDERFERKK